MPKKPVTGEDLRARLASNLFALRRAAKLTQQQAADAADLDLRHYVKIEHGENNVTLKTIVKLANAFGVSTAALLAPPPRHRRP